VFYIACGHFITHSLTHGAEAFLRSHQLCSHSRTPQHFMEPEGSIPCSQEPFTSPYPEPYHSDPISLRYTLILSTHLRLGLPSSLFPSGFPTNILYTFHFSSVRATGHFIIIKNISGEGTSVSGCTICSNKARLCSGNNCVGRFS
jgi:hypothetical protein